MRRLLAIAFGCAVSFAARADLVQFVVQTPDGQRFYASIMPVLVHDNRGWVRFGYTDRLGRLNLNLPPGRYEVMVQARDREFRTIVQVVGSPNLRPVLLR